MGIPIKVNVPLSCNVQCSLPKNPNVWFSTPTQQISQSVDSKLLAPKDYLVNWSTVLQFIIDGTSGCTSEQFLETVSQRSKIQSVFITHSVMQCSWHCQAYEYTKTLSWEVIFLRSYNCSSVNSTWGHHKRCSALSELRWWRKSNSCFHSHWVRNICGVLLQHMGGCTYLMWRWIWCAVEAGWAGRQMRTQYWPCYVYTVSIVICFVEIVFGLMRSSFIRVTPFKPCVIM